jgi:hypothetical protein
VSPLCDYCERPFHGLADVVCIGSDGSAKNDSTNQEINHLQLSIEIIRGYASLSIIRFG